MLCFVLIICLHELMYLGWMTYLLTGINWSFLFTCCKDLLCTGTLLRGCNPCKQCLVHTSHPQQLDSSFLQRGKGYCDFLIFSFEAKARQTREGKVFTLLYLSASFRLAPLVEHSASLLCVKSYARTEGDARVYGSAQRPGQGKQDTHQTSS